MRARGPSSWNSEAQVLNFSSDHLSLSSLSLCACVYVTVGFLGYLLRVEACKWDKITLLLLVRERERQKEIEMSRERERERGGRGKIYEEKPHLCILLFLLFFFGRLVKSRKTADRLNHQLVGKERVQHYLLSELFILIYIREALYVLFVLF